MNGPSLRAGSHKRVVISTGSPPRRSATQPYHASASAVVAEAAAAEGRSKSDARVSFVPARRLTPLQPRCGARRRADRDRNRRREARARCCAVPPPPMIRAPVVASAAGRRISDRLRSGKRQSSLREPARHSSARDDGRSLD
ncbi:hypothetical protein HPB50_010678 [Hyalomma asiaticum]|uniref:Uncharacterized protein n=1 Tax=Hyalomma asiaticum TaxID=266040 RepID=A0ACB7SCK9_HYAAI|nr:hypothetical protein HPB50_010678 [Hyalomma asiaticum]